ncbi:MAG TPA: trypsin-like peptidase domain-containing protein, partial [Terrimesophilobacter sp.]|nr:trypsin-like peptidase domain-containing protein [Terrimesophilobacter sp.]
NATKITAIAATAGPSVVTVSVNAQSAAGTGSGVILTEDGYILTNTHVVTLDGETAHPTITVQTWDGHIYTAKLIGTDPITDLAVIKIEGTFQPLQFADSSKLNVGDEAIAIGAPLGLSNTVTSGIISALNRSITVSSSAAPKDGSNQTPNDNGSGPFNFWEFPAPGDNGQQQQAPTAAEQANIFLPVIQTDAAINPGNSGGALLDLDGKVIGINVAIAGTGSTSQGQSGNIGVGFAIPSNLAKRVAFDMINGGTATHGLLGATVMDVLGDSAIKTKTIVGASVQSVTDGGAAQKAGIRKGDIITEFNGLPITGSIDLTAQVRAAEAGSKATVTYVRDGKSTTVTVTLGELK